MSDNVLHFLVMAPSFLALFALGELLYHKFSVKVELTRKLVHFGTGFLTLLFPVLFDNAWYVFALCASFAAILFVSLRYDLLKSINKIDRKSHGSISYPVAVMLTYLYYNELGDVLYPGHHRWQYLLFYLPVLLLAVCDPMAALFGKRWPYGKYKVGDGHKTVVGTTAFFFSAIILCVVLFLTLTPATVPDAIFTAIPIAFCVGIAEAFSRDGLDNIFIPLCGMIVFQLVEGRWHWLIH